MENTYKYFIRIVSIFMLTIVLIQCKKESTVSPVPITPIVIKEATDVNKFIYNGLKDYYLWVDQAPNLIAPKYAVKDSLNAFLNTYTDPSNLFTSLLYKYLSLIHI